MLFRILGPLEAENDAGPIEFRGFRQRALLAALLTNANDVVPFDVIVDWMWPGGAPASATATLQAHVSILRRALEPDRAPRSASQVLLTRPSGYLIRVEPNQLDALRFERLAERGRLAVARGDVGKASHVLREALGLWRGRALADVGSIDTAQGEIARLESLRLAAVVMRVEADLALGKHFALVPELERLVLEHPLHERICGQLILALYRCGRQADALSTYRRTRLSLAHELGIEPDPALRRLEAAILSQDPCLDWRPD